MIVSCSSSSSSSSSSISIIVHFGRTKAGAATRLHGKR